MPTLDLARFRGTPLNQAPFPYLVVPHFVQQAAIAAIHADFPIIENAGSFPVATLTYGPGFRALLDSLTAPETRAAFAEKFGIDLNGRPTMITVRGRCGAKDGAIHTDSKSKIITALVYMNPAWEESGGRLRLLRSPDDLDDVLVEVPPMEGTLVAFRRSDNSYHGHKPFLGPRRVVQLNWVANHITAQREILRHRVSAWMKTTLRKLRRAS